MPIPSFCIGIFPDIFLDPIIEADTFEGTFGLVIIVIIPVSIDIIINTLNIIPFLLSLVVSFFEKLFSTSSPLKVS